MGLREAWERGYQDRSDPRSPVIRVEAGAEEDRTGSTLRYRERNFATELLRDRGPSRGVGAQGGREADARRSGPVDLHKPLPPKHVILGP